MDVLMEELLHKNPKQLLSELNEEQLLSPNFGKDTNWWLGFIYSAEEKLKDYPKTEALIWGKILIEIYNSLAKRTDSLSGTSLECSAMYLRLRLIERFGVNNESELLNFNGFEKWFWDRLNNLSVTSPITALMLIQNWKNLPIDQIKELREIKNRLKVILAAQESGLIIENNELQTWLNIVSKLP